MDLEYRTPYHNDFHGADVLQTTHCLLLKSNLMNIFTQIEIAALVSSIKLFFVKFLFLLYSYSLLLFMIMNIPVLIIVILLKLKMI